MRLDTKKKIARISLNIFGVLCLLFLILFNSTWFTLPPKPIRLDFALSFLIPLLISIICFLLSGYFVVFTKDDAINQIEKQYKSGLISVDQYKDSIMGIEKFDLEKNKIRAMVEMEKIKFKENLKYEVENFQKQVKIETQNEEE